MCAEDIQNGRFNSFKHLLQLYNDKVDGIEFNIDRVFKFLGFSKTRFMNAYEYLADRGLIHKGTSFIGQTGSGLDIKFSLMRRSLNIPTLGLNIHLHIKPEMTKGTAQENIDSDLKKAEALVIFDKSKASMTPPQNVKTVTPPEYNTVFSRPSQNRRSPKMY